MLPDFSDAQLLQAVKEGDAAAFRALYDRYWERLYIKACQRVNQDEAKDIVQEIMTTLWRRRNEVFTFNDGEIGRYLFTAVKYRVISHYAHITEAIPNSDIFDTIALAATADPLEVKELHVFIENEIRRLPGRMQQVFRMSREDELSIADIARQLNVSEQTVKNQLTEALRRLRTAIKSNNSNDWAFVLFLLFYYSAAN